MKKINYKKEINTSKILADCRPDWCFWLNNGKVLHNIYELLDALISMDDFTFKYHVNGEKDDFVKWINEVICDKTLAKELLTVKNREDYVNKVKKRIKQLEKNNY